MRSLLLLTLILLATAARADTLTMNFSGFDGPYNAIHGVFVGEFGIQGDPSPGFEVSFYVDGVYAAICADACGLLTYPDASLSDGSLKLFGFEPITAIYTSANTAQECEALGFSNNTGAGPFCLGQVFSSATYTGLNITGGAFSSGSNGYEYTANAGVTLTIDPAFANYFGAGQGEYTGTLQLNFAVPELLIVQAIQVPIFFSENVVVNPVPKPSAMLLLATAALALGWRFRGVAKSGRQFFQF